MADLKSMKGISEADRKLIADAEEWLGAEPTKMGPAKNLFWGNVKEEFYFPYHETDRRRSMDRETGKPCRWCGACSAGFHPSSGGRMRASP